MGKQVTYRDLRTVTVQRSNTDNEIWTIAADETVVMCFADGNNAVFFTPDGQVMASNGKARQFVDHATGDGLLMSNGELRPIKEPDLSSYSALVRHIIKVGLELCGQKDIDEIVEAATTASSKPAMKEQDASVVTFNVTLANLGAIHCSYEFDAGAVAAYLRAKSLSVSDVRADMATNLRLAQTAINTGGPEFCEKAFYPEFGPAGYGLVTR